MGQTSAAAQKRVGTLLREKYHLDRVIDVGGMATVYEATHRNGKHVAIKLLHPQLLHDDEARRRFLREGYVANHINHPSALQILDDDVDDATGAIFLVMELLTGETLGERIDRKAKLGPTEVFSVADRILDVLIAAHGRKILHRDIKPANIYLTEDGGVKVLDFGFARLREAQSHEDTHDGLVIGTAAYMSPEQARARSDEIDPRSDIWSVGATMFTAMTGLVVHGGGTPVERLYAAATKPAKSLGSAAPELPETVVRLVDKALQFDKADRWQSATEMQNALRAAYGDLAPATADPTSLRTEWAPGENSSRDEASVVFDLVAPSTGAPSAEPPADDAPALVTDSMIGEVPDGLVADIPEGAGLVTDSMIAEIPDGAALVTDSMVTEAPEAGVPAGLVAEIPEEAGLVTDSMIAEIPEEAGLVTDSMIAEIPEEAGLVTDSMIAEVPEEAPDSTAAVDQMIDNLEERATAEDRGLVDETEEPPPSSSEPIPLERISRRPKPS